MPETVMIPRTIPGVVKFGSLLGIHTPVNRKTPGQKNQAQIFAILMVRGRLCLFRFRGREKRFSWAFLYHSSTANGSSFSYAPRLSLDGQISTRYQAIAIMTLIATTGCFVVETPLFADYKSLGKHSKASCRSEHSQSWIVTC